MARLPKRALNVKPVQATQEPSQEPPRYFTVNPSGAIHEVAAESVQGYLQRDGWRLATPEEIALLNAQHGLQTFDNPIGKRGTL